MSKEFKAWFKTQAFIPQGDYSYAEIAWDAAVEATKEKAAKVCEETEYCSLTSEERPMLWFECAAAIRSMK